jgi:hypothetical protein
MKAVFIDFAIKMLLISFISGGLVYGWFVCVDNYKEQRKSRGDNDV